jgi:putative ABC transport system ATP-binding protein
MVMGTVKPARRCAETMPEPDPRRIRLAELRQQLAEGARRDNVALLAMLLGRSNKEARAAADALLADLDVAHRADAMPNLLSGGEQQRVAIARALINRPPILLADEPTAPLDSPRAMAVMDLLERLALQIGTSVIVVTHDEKILPRMRRIYEVRGGVVAEPTNP